jgi:hypothetical protein
MVRALALCLLVACSALPAAGQGVDPTLLRAAYCVGVLKESIKMFDGLASGLEQSDLKTGTIKTSAQYKLRHKRYADYLALHVLGTVDHGRDAMIGAVVAKGERDAAGGLSASDWNAYTQCRNVHKSPAEVISCFASTNETEANVLRCQSLPDGLPF